MYYTWDDQNKLCIVDMLDFYAVVKRSVIQLKNQMSKLVI